MLDVCELGISYSARFYTAGVSYFQYRVPVARSNLCRTPELYVSETAPVNKPPSLLDAFYKIFLFDRIAGQADLPSVARQRIQKEFQSNQRPLLRHGAEHITRNGTHKEGTQK